MKRLFSTFGFLLCIQSIYCQTDSISNWLVNVNIGIEAHDKRLYNYSKKASLLEMQPDFWGTYHLGLNIQRKIFEKDRIYIFLGTGVAFEKATFNRPFNHFHFEKDSFYILRALDNYNKVQSPLSVSTLCKLKERLFIRGDISSNFVLSRRIENSESDPLVFPYKEKSLNFEGISMDLGVVYVVKKIWIGLNSRIINYQKIDKIIFNSLIRDPRLGQKWEWNNPLQLEFIIGYMW